MNARSPRVAVVVAAVTSLSGPAYGMIAASRLRTAIRGLHPRLAACSQIHSSLRGRVVVGFDIESDGRTTRPRVVEPASLDHAAARCVVEAIKRVRFDAGNRRISVNYPFVFAG